MPPNENPDQTNLPNDLLSKIEWLEELARDLTCAIENISAVVSADIPWTDDQAEAITDALDIAGDACENAVEQAHQAVATCLALEPANLSAVSS